MDENYIEFYALQVKQPLGNFYIGKIDGKELFDTSFAEVRNMRQDDIGQRLGIQRELNNDRVREIKKYVRTVDACFPNSVILSTKKSNIVKCEEIAKNIYKLTLIKNEKTFQIIDGQHRIAGLENYPEDDKFEVNVSLFIELDPEAQAVLFSTINIKQAKVSKSLSYELMALQEIRNPIKTAHYIGRVVNSKDNALRGRISSLATINPEDGYTITQATFIQRVIKYISGNENQLIEDRDLLKRGKRLVYSNEKTKDKLIFRNMFIDEQDAEIAKIIMNYFNAVSDRWPKAWNEDGYVLKKTIGFNALMIFLRDVINYLGMYDAVVKEEVFENVLQKVKVSDEEWSVDKFNLSGYGQSDVLRKLRDHFEK